MVSCQPLVCGNFSEQRESHPGSSPLPPPLVSGEPGPRAPSPPGISAQLGQRLRPGELLFSLRRGRQGRVTRVAISVPVGQSSQACP